MNSFIRIGNVILLIALAVLLNLGDSWAKIPISHIKGVDEIFQERYKVYSPLIGMLNHRPFLSKWYGTGKDEPIQNLVSRLFTEVPGGEIFPTHLGKIPAAHLSSTSIAKILIEFEKTRDSVESPSQLSGEFEERIRKALTSDDEYLSSINRAISLTEKARQELSELPERIQKQKELAAEAEAFKSKWITPLDRSISKLRRSMKNQNSDSSELDQLLTERSTLLEKYQELRQELGPTKKEQEKKLKYLIETNDVLSEAYQIQLTEFISALANCFLTYEMSPQSVPEMRYATTVTLLSYLWMKYTSKEDLRGYLEAMSTAGFIRPEVSLTDWFFRDSYSSKDYLRLKNQFTKRFRKEKWVRENFSGSLAASVDHSETQLSPPVVQFGYLKWVRYSSFPDCCENAIHNILNLIAFNPETGAYDAEILMRLKEQFYPEMNPKLIEFYEKYPAPESHDSIQAAADWIQVVSGLNQGLEHLPPSEQIHYRGTVSHVASPYSNLLKVMNRLLGYSDLRADHMLEIFTRVKSISQFDVQYSSEDVDDEGFGQVLFSVGSKTYVFEAYRPLHVGFYLTSNQGDSWFYKIYKIFFRKANRKKSDEVKSLRYLSGLKMLQSVQFNSIARGGQL